MTHEEILQLLYDETLVGNAPAVQGRSSRGSRTAWTRARCSTTR